MDRRTLIKLGLCGPAAMLGQLVGVQSGLAQAAQAAEGGVNTSTPPWRRALLIGNGAYESPESLPSVPTNVVRLAAKLEKLGFEVQQGVDVQTPDMISRFNRFIQEQHSAPPGSLSVMYFAGHGFQYEANNYLLGVELSPVGGLGQTANQALNVQSQWFEQLPQRADCLQVAIIDACRTGTAPVAQADSKAGLNQVKAPLGSIVTFSTQAGKSAVAPIDPEKLTFFTQALVDELAASQSYMTFGQVLRLVKQRVYDTMRNHPLGIIRSLAQDPFIAENSPIEIALALLPQEDDNRDEQEKADWLAIEQAVWPPTLLRLIKAFSKNYPNSARLPLANVYAKGANQVLNILRLNDTKLYKSSFRLPEGERGPARENDLVRAARGDKDSAARIAKAYQLNDSEQFVFRYEGWLQMAAGLGNGIAAYDLALHYRELALLPAASAAEARAIELGFEPPATLKNKR